MLETYNPILSKEELGFFKRPPVPEPGVALVFSGSGRPLLTLMQGKKSLTWGESHWNYNLLYRVDMAEHPLSFQCEAPCKGDGYNFQAEVLFRCAVNDPEKIVQRHITDVAQWLKTSIEDILRPISRKYEIKEAGNAEVEIKGAVRQAISEAGFDLSNFTLKLSLPAEAVEWLQTQAREEAKQQLTQQKLDFELKLVRQKTDFYSALLQSGNVQHLALQLAQNPEDVQAILQALNQQKQIERETQIKLLEMFLDANVVEEWQLSEVGKHTLKEFIKGLTGPVGQPLPILPSEPSFKNNTEKQLSNQSSLKTSVRLDKNIKTSSDSEPSEPDWEDDEKNDLI